jgi:ATP-dependent exoDNAse (exonuclease V) alpha subunit
MIQTEQEIVAITASLATRPWHKADKGRLNQSCRHLNLSREQIAAAVSAADANRIAIIEGAPGAGKTTALGPVVDACRAAGCRVIGTATAWRIANMLRDDLQIESRATAAWLAAANRGEHFLDANTLLIVDESGLIASREMRAILAEVERTGAKVLLVGDREQLQPVGAGPALTLVARAIQASRVNNIVRQREPWAREAITQFGKGEARKALSAFQDRGRLVEGDGQSATIRAVADARDQIFMEDPKSTILLMAKTNVELTAISREVRRRLKERGVIRGPEVIVAAVTPSGQGTEVALAAGDQIRFLARNDRFGVINGTVATVTRVTGITHADNPDSQQIEADIGGRTIVFSPADIADKKGRARLTWGYASTVFGGQGLTVDHAVVLTSTSMNRHDIYVAASRARNRTILVVNRKAIEHDCQAGYRMHAQAAEDGTSITLEDRLDFLATALSRASAKESTLDVIDETKIRERQLAATRNRDWEVRHEA